MTRSFVIVSTYALLLLAVGCATEKPKLATIDQDLNDLTDRDYAEVEKQLAPLATPLPKPGPGDWLAQHKESGQTFAQYLRAKPVRKSEQCNRIFLCLIGDFSSEQEQVLKITGEYLQAFYQVPVEVHEKLSLEKIPDYARRTHPSWGDKQILTTYVLDDVLEPHRPGNALAYIAFTSSDLWPGEGWNFVFGQASLSERVGVWSIYRNGDPAKSPEDFQLCLTRTMKTASHETGHILGMPHCTAFHCNMNGSNNRAESDRGPLHLCPVCLRKVCWNLQVDPEKYLREMEAFCEKHELAEEVKWYREARAALQK